MGGCQSKKMSIKQWCRHKKKTPKQNKSKEAAAVQSAALLCSVSVQFSTVMAPGMLNSVNHTLIKLLTGAEHLGFQWCRKDEAKLNVCLDLLFLVSCLGWI